MQTAHPDQTGQPRAHLHLFPYANLSLVLLLHANLRSFFYRIYIQRRFHMHHTHPRLVTCTCETHNLCLRWHFRAMKMKMKISWIFMQANKIQQRCNAGFSGSWLHCPQARWSSQWEVVLQGDFHCLPRFSRVMADLKRLVWSQVTQIPTGFTSARSQFPLQWCWQVCVKQWLKMFSRPLKEEARDWFLLQTGCRGVWFDGLR